MLVHKPLQASMLPPNLLTELDASVSTVSDALVVVNLKLMKGASKPVLVVLTRLVVLMLMNVCARSLVLARSTVSAETSMRPAELDGWRPGSSDRKSERAPKRAE